MSLNAVPSTRDEMSLPALVSWAWTETAPVHRNRKNLLIHVVAVPLFVLGHILFLAAFVTTGWLLAAGLACVAASLALQQVGHSLERQPAIPFSGRRDFVRRIYAEQFINFWRFLFTGGWYANFRSSGMAMPDPQNGDAR